MRISTKRQRVDKPNEKPAVAMGARSLRGFTWMFGQTVLLKFLGLVVQFALGLILLKEDFALVALVLTVTAFTGLLQDAGLSQLLVHRNRHFHCWANAAFWMSLFLGVFSGFIIICSIPIVTWIYQSDRLTGLLLTMALGAPLGSLNVVPGSRMQGQMRFRELAAVGTAAAIVTYGLTVSLALLGVGPYALVLPPLIVNPIRAAVLWSLCRPQIRSSPQFRRWRYLVGDSGLLLASSFFITITMQIDNIVLGMTATKSEVGDYFFAFNLSMQATAMLSGALSTVLFPAFSALQLEADRQRDAFIRAATVMAAVGIPLCFLQILLASPLLRLAFADKWANAIPIVQILSVGMAMQVVNGVAVSLVQAQGRFGTFLKITTGLAVQASILVTIGAVINGPIGVAVAACINAAVGGMMLPYLALKPLGASLNDVLSIYLGPVLASSLAVAITAMLTRHIAGVEGRYVPQLICIFIAFPLIYSLCARLFMPSIWEQLMDIPRRVGFPLTRKLRRSTEL
jgi:O-antigen/teichoic acid export membrane protein